MDVDNGDQRTPEQKYIAMLEEEVIRLNSLLKPNDSPNITELKSHVDKLAGLLSDPHPGLFTWLNAVNNKIEAIAEFYGLTV